jgi:hypothetical protein
MPLSTLLHLEYDPVEPTDAMKHMVFSCQQTKGPNLEVLPATATQRFAVLYGEELDDDLIGVLERAYASGTLSPVKLIAAEENKLYIFLDSAVASATIPMIESLWANVVETGDGSWEVSFATETEALSGRSDFKCWDDAKEVLESYSLGIESFESSALDQPQLSIYADEKWRLHDTGSKQNPEFEAGGIHAKSTCSDGDQPQGLGGSVWSCVDKSCLDGPKLLSTDELIALGQAVRSCRSLRDQCLRASLMSGIRVLEITSIKVKDVRISAAKVEFRVTSTKARKPAHRLLTPNISPESLCRYVQEHQLSSEDYLFPSEINAAKPMSKFEIKKAFYHWLLDAQVGPSQLAPHSICTTLNRLRQSATPQSVAQFLGHHSTLLMTAYYCRPRDQPSQ